MMLVMHGGIFLCIKTGGNIQNRARNYARGGSMIFILLFILAGYFIAYHIKGYILASPSLPDGFSNPLYKQVVTQTGAWINNYQLHPQWIAAPLTGFLGALFALFLLTIRAYKSAWILSSLCIAGVIATVGASMYPFIIPSSTHPNMGLLLWDSSSSKLTLLIMLVSALIFIPIIIAYTSWIYYVLRGKISERIY